MGDIDNEDTENKIVFVKSKQGKDVLLRNGFRYTFHLKNKISGSTNWRCCNQNDLCNTSITIDSTKSKVLRESTHTCNSDHLRNKIEICIDKCKAQVCTSMEPVQRIFEQQFESLKEETDSRDAFNVPAFKSKKDSLYRHRYRALNVDKCTFNTPDEVTLPQIITEKFLIRRENNILIFCTPLALQTAQTVENFLGDGTFKVVPKPYYQLYSLHADLSKTDHSAVVPLFYILMPNKTEKSYKTLFTVLKNVFSINMRNFTSDFETAVMNAVKSVYPEVLTNGCYFHYQKAIFKKANSLGLDNEESDRTFLKKLAKLALLPPALIPEGFLAISENVDNKVEMSEFKEYFMDQWMKKVTSDVFSCYGTKNKTTSLIESWHRRLNIRIGEKNNLFQFLSKLKKEAKHQEFNIKLCSKPVMKKKKDRDIEISSIVQECVAGNISVAECIDLITPL